MLSVFDFTPGLTAYILAVSFVFGLVMGSFLNCMAWRLAHGESVAKGRSRCAVCGHTLSAAELVPVFSYIFLRGRCRWCGDKISLRYPAVELVTGVVYLSVVIKLGFSFATLMYLILFTLVFCAALVDIDVFLIPDRLIVAGILGYLLLSPFAGDGFLIALKNGVIGGLSVSLPLLVLVLITDKVMKKETMGGGDIKLMFMIGMYFNWKCNILLLIFACFIGIVLSLVKKLVSRTDISKGIPFGPSIAAASFVVFLCGEPLINAYLELFYR